MTIAELHGKLSPDQPYGCHDRMEDLLTSDVFGTMRYAGWSRGFLDWIHGAEAVPVLEGPIKPVSEILPVSHVRTVDFAFWPTLPNGRQPDVVLLFQCQDKSSVLIVVEVKYLSGTSDYEIPDERDDYARTGNQIADQVIGIASLSVEKVCEWLRLPRAPRVRERVHLFVTKDAWLPVPVYEIALAYLPAPWPVPAYWLSWTSLAKHLEPHKQQPDPGCAALVEDLLALLRRKELMPYGGFDLTPWVPASVLPGFWLETWWNLPTVLLSGSPRFWAPSFWNLVSINIPPYVPIWEEDQSRE